MRDIHTGRVPMRGAHLLIATFLLMMISATANAAAPKISGTPPTTITVGNQYNFTPTASDADGNTLTFSVVNKPGFASFDAKTGRLYGLTLAQHARTWSGIVISVTDGTTKVSLPAFSLVVKPNLSNLSPTITGTPPATGQVGTLYSFTPTARDPEGKPLQFSISGKPAWATFSASTGRLSGTPTAAGTFGKVMILVTDGVTTAMLMPLFSITVSGGTTNSPPVISGTPPTSTTVGAAYSFQPSASDANGDPLTFSITNKPAWASFSTSTGRLTGTPTTAHIGTTTGVVIRVSDGKATTSLQSFSLAVTQVANGNATLTWTPPTRNTDGTTLSNVAGYRILYGTSASSLNRTAEVRNPSISTYVVENLSPGAWYFSVKAFTSSGSESAPSRPVSVTVR
jgi:hypothetical protein